MATKLRKPKPRAGAPTRSTAEDLLPNLRDTGAKVRMRVVLELDVEEDNFDREAFNERTVEVMRQMEHDDLGEIVYLTTEEIVPS